MYTDLIVDCQAGHFGIPYLDAGNFLPVLLAAIFEVEIK